MYDILYDKHKKKCKQASNRCRYLERSENLVIIMILIVLVGLYRSSSISSSSSSNNLLKERPCLHDDSNGPKVTGFVIHPIKHLGGDVCTKNKKERHNRKIIIRNTNTSTTTNNCDYFSIINVKPKPNTSPCKMC